MSSVSDCLRSLAYQMACSNVEVRKTLLALHADGLSVDKDNERAVWRKFFLEGVLQAKLTQPHYWVIDALDECSKAQSFLSIFGSIESQIPLRIFITSRKTQEIERAFVQLGPKIMHLEILASDTLEDIKSFIESRIDRLPVEGDESKLNLCTKILAKSEGSFLWVRLVVQELEHTWSEEAIEEVLHEVPADMNLLYMRALDNMSRTSRATKLAKAILMWTVCALRPLTISEMQSALKIDIGETMCNLNWSISSICGQLVFVDQRSRIQMVHQTVRDFLIQDGLDSEFAVRKVEGHAHIAVKCLKLLSEARFKPTRTQNQKLTIPQGSAKDAALINYACTFFSDHLYRASSLESEPWDALYEFLDRNVLAWIEHLANTGDLYYITRTAINIKAYLARRAKYFPPFGQQVRTIDAWTVDLIRLTAKFRTALLTSPSSIYRLIPPMCPSESIISRKFTSSHRGLAVKGSVEKTWDDCLTLINYLDAQTTAIAHGDRSFAVGLSAGKIIMYHTISGQVHRVLNHVERVKILEFGDQDKVLASSGIRNVRIWDLSTGQQIWCFKTSYQALALAFTSENECLLAASQGNYVICWCLSNGSEKKGIPWHDGFKEPSNKIQQRSPPTRAAFSLDRNLLAVSYRGRPILLFDLALEIFFGECFRNSGSIQTKAETHYPVVAMEFQPSLEISLLIASYGDGELVAYNPKTLELRHRTANVNAHTLACSPDGRTLVTGSSFGTIQVFDFDGAGGETLTPIYRIDAYEEGIKSLTFSNDSLRFIDIRGSQCRVWEPSVLVRKDLEDCDDESEVSDPSPMVNASVKMAEGDIKAEITAMVCDNDGDAVFYGKQDGSVIACLIQDVNQDWLLYKHSSNTAITSIAWGQREHILASVDESSRIVIRKLVKHQTVWSASEILTDQRFAGSVCGLLISPTNDTLLVDGKESFELWTMQGQKLGSRTCLPQKHQEIFSHPLQLSTFVSFELDTVHIFNWSNFEELTAPEGVKLNRPSEPIVKSSATAISYHGNNILVELTGKNGDQSSTKLECWQTSDIMTSSTSIKPLPGFEMLGPFIKYIIAVNGNTLLFLDTDLWVCSLDLKNFAITPEAKRHFFIPSDWLSISGDVFFHLTPKNEFVFAKKDGLLVIRRGMEYSEKIPLSKA